MIDGKVGKKDISRQVFLFPVGIKASPRGIQFPDNDVAFEFCLEVIAAMADRELQTADEHDKATDPLRSLVLRALA